MRITVTLDDDVAKLLRCELRRSGASLKAGVNHFLRLGLMASARPAARPFVVHPGRWGCLPASVTTVSRI
jgi:hypothetical protein